MDLRLAKEIAWGLLLLGIYLLTLAYSIELMLSLISVLIIHEHLPAIISLNAFKDTMNLMITVTINLGAILFATFVLLPSLSKNINFRVEIQPRKLIRTGFFMTLFLVYAITRYIGYAVNNHDVPKMVFIIALFLFLCSIYSIGNILFSTLKIFVDEIFPQKIHLK